MDKFDPALFQRKEPVYPKSTPEVSYVVDLPKVYPVTMRTTADYNFEIRVLNYVAPEEFLANPRTIPAVFADAGFQEKARDCIGFSHDQPLPRQVFILEYKITQDTPACRNVIREMFRTDPKRAATLCLTPDGVDVFSFKDENMDPVRVI